MADLYICYPALTMGFIDMDDFRKTTGERLLSMQAAIKMPGKDKIYTDGGKKSLVWQKRKEKGVPLNKQLQKNW